MDVHTKEQRSRNMRAIRSVNTKMEIVLAKAFWARGHRYRKNDRNVFGRPDLTLKRHKLAVFVDGEFFQGKDWETSKFVIKLRREFWWTKIEVISCDINSEARIYELHDRFFDNLYFLRSADDVLQVWRSD